MHHDDRGRTVFQRPFHHLARIDGRAVYGAGALYLVGDQAVLGIEEQQAEFLGPAVAHGNAEVIDQFGPRGQDRPVGNLFAHGAARGLCGHRDQGDGGFADAFDGGKLRRGCGQHTGDRAEAVDQRLRRRLGIALAAYAEQQVFQQLVIGEAVAAAVQHAAA